jgi:hypothetical protein
VLRFRAELHHCTVQVRYPNAMCRPALLLVLMSRALLNHDATNACQVPHTFLSPNFCHRLGTDLLRPPAAPPSQSAGASPHVTTRGAWLCGDVCGLNYRVNLSLRVARI